MRFHLLLLPFLLGSSARACLNDRDSDSLALQAAQFPDTLRVITGRFERQPPLFYQMRIQRSLAELKRNPRDFGLYDDIAVAFDKLHRDDDALKIMAKKRALLPPFDAKNPAMKEAWYRTFANTGTFHAHRYLGAKSGDLAEMKLARNMIKRAIEIKPNAHFGREKYQLMAMDWILATRSGKTDQTLGEWIDKRDGWDFKEKPMHKAAKGLSGLIVLGAAWQSVDVFDALASSLRTQKGITVSQMASLRTQELMEQGRVPLARKGLDARQVTNKLSDASVADMMVSIQPKNQKALREAFYKLRAEAESWHLERQGYIIDRMEIGDHPDMNPKFWATWKPAAPPSLEVNWINSAQQQRERMQNQRRTTLLMGGLLFSTVLALGLWSWRCHAVRRRAAS